MRPTAAGAALAGHVAGIIAQMEAAEDEIAAISAGRGGRLRTASFPTAGASLMPQAIAGFRASHPGVDVTLAEGEPEEIGPRLRAGEFDLVLLFEFEGVGERLEARDPPLPPLRGPARPRPARRPPARAPRAAAPRGPPRGGLDTDLGDQPLRAPRRPLMPRRRLRAAGLIRERRLPDGAGPGRRRSRGRPDPPPRPLGDPRGHRRAGAQPRQPGPQGLRRDAAGGRCDHGGGDDARHPARRLPPARPAVDPERRNRPRERGAVSSFLLLSAVA